MKIFFWIVLFFFISNNILYAKILNIENKIQIEVPTSHTYIKYENKEVREFIKELTDSIKGTNMDLYLVGPKKYVDLEKAIIDGEDPMNNKYLKSLMQKAKKKRFTNEAQQSKWLISEAKKILKKEKIDFISYAVFLNKAITEISLEEEGEEVADMITELQTMTNSELKKKTKEIRKDLTSLSGNNKSILINESMTINLNKFNIAKNEYEKLFLRSSGELIFVIGSIRLDIKLNAFITEHNNNTFMFLSACYVSCSKFNNKFDKMISHLFSTNLSNQLNTTSKSSVINSDIVDQLKSLNDLYKSGVLTKEEFDKAKKKILN